jgi:hypothetical protein
MSSLEAIGAWREARLPFARYVPLAGLIAWAANGSDWGARGVATSVIAFALVAQFRLWDDLVDRGRDALAHPDRTIVRAASSRPFVQALFALGVGNGLALALSSGLLPAFGLLALMLLLALWYRGHARRGLLHLHVLLLKYPVFIVLLAAPSLSARALAVAACAVYAAMCCYDLADASLGEARAVRAAWATHALVLVALPLACGGEVAEFTICALNAALMAALWRARARAIPRGLERYVPFLCAASILCITTRGTW